MRPGLFTHTIDLVRRTAYVVDPVAAGTTIAVDRQPVRASYLAVVAASAGSVTVSGTTTETLAFATAGGKRTVAQYTTLSGVTSAGLSGVVSVTAVDSANHPQHAGVTVASAIPAGRSYFERGSYPIGTPGPKEQQGASWALDYSEVFVPRVGDLVVERETGDQWYVEVADIQRSPVRPYGWVLQAKRYLPG